MIRPSSNDWCPYKNGKWATDIHIRRMPCENTAIPQKLGDRTRRDCPSRPPGAPTLPTSWFWSSSLQNCEMTNFCLSHWVCGAWQWQTSKLMQRLYKYSCYNYPSHHSYSSVMKITEEFDMKERAGSRKLTWTELEHRAGRVYPCCLRGKTPSGRADQCRLLN